MCFLVKKWKGTFDSNIYENIISIINVPFFPWDKLISSHMVSPFCLTSELNVARPEECTVYTLILLE